MYAAWPPATVGGTYLPKDKARSLQIGRNVDKHTQTKHLYAQLELFFTTLSGGSDTYTPIL